jgi:hypothetical protein
MAVVVVVVVVVYTRLAGVCDGGTHLVQSMATSNPSPSLIPLSFSHTPLSDTCLSAALPI